MSIALLLGVTSSISFINIKKVNDSYSDIVNRRAVILSNAKDMQNSASKEIGGLKDVLLNEAGSAETVTESIAELDANITATNELVKREDVTQLLKELQTINEKFKGTSEYVFDLAKSSPEEAKRIVTFELKPLAKESSELADQIAVIQANDMSEAIKVNTTMVDSVIDTILIISSIGFILAILIGVLVSRLITKPIVAVSKGAKQIAEGNLSIEDINVKNNDEIGELAKSFNEMKMNLRHLIGQVGFSTRRIAAASEGLSASAGETTKATEQITMAIQEVAIGSEKQVSSAVEATGAAEEISKGMNRAAASIQSVSDLTAAASSKAHSGNKVAADAVTQMNQVHLAVKDTAEAINRLGEKSKEVGQIVNLITNIAKQTNLLALNASIEAARAGENGRGFAVVAHEVRKLAEQSGDSANQIRELIEQVQSEADRAVQSMHEGTEVVKEGINMVHLTGESFNDIVSSIEEAAAESAEVSAIVEQVDASSQSMLEMIEGVAHIAEQSAANTQNVAASAEEQNASMEEVSASAETLSKMAQDLQAAISSFKV